MTWQSIQIGDQKAKKRVCKAWYDLMAVMFHPGDPDAMAPYERDLKFARKTTKRCACIGCHTTRKNSGPSAAERRNMMKYSLEGVE